MDYSSNMNIIVTVISIIKQHGGVDYYRLFIRLLTKGKVRLGWLWRREGKSLFVGEGGKKGLQQLT